MDLEPIPYYYDMVNRSSILIRHKKPFLDWLNKTFDEEDDFATDGESNIYLIRQMDSTEAIERWIKKNFDNIFINELNDWYTDEAGWPKNRSYKLFREWFDVEIHSMVLDLEDFPITKE